METFIGGILSILVAAFMLYQNFNGKIRLTFRAGCYMWFLLFAGITFIGNGLAEVITPAFASPTPTPFHTRTPPAAYLTTSARIAAYTPTPVCLHWSKVTPQMQGRTVCVFGDVQAVYPTDTIATRINFTDTPNSFFIFSAAYIFSHQYTGKPLSPGDCLQFTGTVQLYNSIPFMDIGERPLYFCN